MTIKIYSINGEFLNQKLEDSVTDSGWMPRAQGDQFTVWHRTVKLARYINPEDIVKQLFQTKDYPGLTGVEISTKLSNHNYVVFTSTYNLGE